MTKKRKYKTTTENLNIRITQKLLGKHEMNEIWSFVKRKITSEKQLLGIYSSCFNEDSANLKPTQQLQGKKMIILQKCRYYLKFLTNLCWKCIENSIITGCSKKSLVALVAEIIGVMRSGAVSFPSVRTAGGVECWGVRGSEERGEHQHQHPATVVAAVAKSGGGGGHSARPRCFSSSVFSGRLPFSTFQRVHGLVLFHSERRPYYARDTRPLYFTYSKYIHSRNLKLCCYVWIDCSRIKVCFYFFLFSDYQPSSGSLFVC